MKHAKRLITNKRSQNPRTADGAPYVPPASDQSKRKLSIRLTDGPGPPHGVRPGKPAPNRQRGLQCNENAKVAGRNQDALRPLEGHNKFRTEQVKAPHGFDR